MPLQSVEMPPQPTHVPLIYYHDEDSEGVDVMDPQYRVEMKWSDMHDGAIELIVDGHLSRDFKLEHKWGRKPRRYPGDVKTYLVNRVAMIVRYQDFPVEHSQVAFDAALELLGQEDVFDDLVEECHRKLPGAQEKSQTSDDSGSYTAHFLKALDCFKAEDLITSLTEMPHTVNLRSTEAPIVPLWTFAKYFLREDDEVNFKILPGPLRTQSPSPRPGNKAVRNKGPVATVFGNIAGVKIGDSWKGRGEITECGLHCRQQGSVHGRKEEGVFSLILAGAYTEDKIVGETITFTGVGGKDSSVGSKKVDQGSKMSIEQLTQGPPPGNTENASLYKSVKTGKPVRVVASAKAGFGFCGDFEGFKYIGGGTRIRDILSLFRMPCWCPLAS
ncbi:E3 ubiquitin-protein ligase uhrf1 [Arthrobotrys megalospora]